MGSEAVLAIGGVVGAISRFLVAAGVSGRASAIGSVLVSLVAVGVYAFSAGDFARETAFAYLATFAEVMLVAAGAFHIIENSSAASKVVDKMTGTGSGATPPFVGLALVAALSGSLALAGCGAKVPPIDPLPAATESIGTDVRAFTVHALEITRLAGEVAVDASDIVLQFKNRGAIPVVVEAQIDKAFRAFSAKMRDAIDALERGGVASWAALKAVLDPVLADLQTVIDSVKNAGPNIWQKVGHGLLTALSLLLAATGPGLPQ